MRALASRAAAEKSCPGCRPVLAARHLRIPVILHEANVIPGRAIACLSRFATVLGIGFEETRRVVLAMITSELLVSAAVTEPVGVTRSYPSGTGTTTRQRPGQ